MRYALHNLEGMYSCSIILALRDGSRSSTDLERELGVAYSVVKSNTDRLAIEGFLTRERESVKPFKVIFALTEKGRMVADHLAEIEIELGGEL